MGILDQEIDNNNHKNSSPRPILNQKSPSKSPKTAKLTKKVSFGSISDLIFNEIDPPCMLHVINHQLDCLNFSSLSQREALSIIKANPLQPVVLREIVFNHCFFEGTLLVKNFSFHKLAFIRYSFDCWKTFAEVVAYFRSCDQENTVDEFGFRIDCLLKDSLQCEFDLQLAIRYRVDGNEYWDNNSGNNYHMLLKIEFDQNIKPISPRTSHRIKSDFPLSNGLSARSVSVPNFNDVFYSNRNLFTDHKRHFGQCYEFLNLPENFI